MTDAARLRQALTHLDLTQNSAASLCGVSARTVRGWCSESETAGRGVPEPVWRLLDLIETVPGTKDRLTALASQTKGTLATN